MCDSRFEILKILKKECCTVDALSDEIGISPTAVRQHLTILERESLVKRETKKEGIGRPKVIYSTTEEAENLFPKFYSWLAECLIDGVITEYGEEKMESLLEEIGTKFSQPYREQVNGKSLEARIAVVTTILNEWGAYAFLENDGEHYVLKNYNCSFYEVAQKYPQVCRVHAVFLEQLLNQRPQQIASMSRGDEFCGYQITV